MSTEAIGAAAPEATIVIDVVEQPAVAAASAASSRTTGLHSPPDSNNAMNLDCSDSELSDIDEVANKLAGKFHVDDAPAPSVTAETEEAPPKVDVEVEDIGEVLPDHYSGTVPVFRPTMKQFRDFKLFMGKIDGYGMKSGIVKIIPPKEWKDSLKPLDDLIKQVRVREPIKQDIMGSNGTYRQVNILHGRSYNIPQWRQLCDQSEHQPPARRGERRANAEKHKAVRSTRSTASTSTSKTTTAPGKRKRGRPSRASKRLANEEAEDQEDRPMTPVSPPPEKEEVIESVEQDPGVEEVCDNEDDEPVVRRMGFTRQSKPKTQSTSARRKYSRREGSAKIDEEAFRDFDYRMDISDYTPERCEELERIYWKTLTYAPPLYGADLMGTLFDESTELWNLNKLPNLLDVLGTKVPGVNTAYLYLGMWKATFAWHLEDVDLYSINYLHFGAPKQWYSISQADARRFEAAMKNIWPTEAKACDQFLRHKAFLISPAHLKQHYNITVNKCVSYPGEFVVTYPYGYHSGYNLGYNCAEAVNFALDSWLPMGKIAKKCQCAQAQDSVWIDVYEIERKLRGEETEYEETEDEEEEEEEDDEQDTGLPSPPSSHTVRVKGAGRKRKRLASDQGEGKAKVKKVRLRLKSHVEPPCCLCPHDIPGAAIMPTDDGRKAHRMCALYLPETYIETVDGEEVVANVGGIDKARLELKCLYCRSKKGACFQCSQKKCPRSYHATCGAAAGVFVEEAEVPVFGEDGTEYKEQAFEFSCRFHRTKRDRRLEGEVLEDNVQIRETAAALKQYDICQIQYYRGDIFAGVVLENRKDEETLLLQVVPNGDRVEVEWKWLLLPDPADFRLPKASPNAIPMPTSRKAQKELNAKRPVDDLPRKDDEFAAGYIWAEFHTSDAVKNSEQVKLDLAKENQIWHYLGKTSTESKAQYTEDLARPQHNTKSNFLDTIPKPPKPVAVPPRRSHGAPPSVLPKVTPVPLPGGTMVKQEKPYIYKPRKPVEPTFGVQFTSQKFAPTFSASSPGPMLPQMQPHQFAPHSPLPQPVYPNRMQQSLGAQEMRPPPTLPPQPRPHNDAQPAGHYQPFTKDQQQKKSPDRFAPVGGSNGFPQLPGLTWPPAHMKSGHHFQPHSRVWPSPTDAAAATGPPPTPMTSSIIKSLVSDHPLGTTGAQPPASTHMRYPFFQVHHNRDSTRYRTPYGQWGGFTNGYEGNLRAFLIKAQRALSGGKTPIKAIPPSLLHPLDRPGTSGHGYSSPYDRTLPRPESGGVGESRPLGPTNASSRPGLAQSSPAYESSTFEARQPGSIPLHPATRPQFDNFRQASPGNAVENSWSQSPQTPGVGTLQPRPSSQHPGSPVDPTLSKTGHSPTPLPPSVKQGSQRASPLGQPPQQASHNAELAARSDHALSGPQTSTAPSVPPLSIQQFHVAPAVVPPYNTADFPNPPQQLQWEPPYEAPRQHQISAAGPPPPAHTAAPTQQLPQSYHQAPEYAAPSMPSGGAMQPCGTSPTSPNFAEISTASVNMEQMMLNLKRASQMGR